MPYSLPERRNNPEKEEGSPVPAKGPARPKPRRVSWDLLRVTAVGLVLLFHGTFLARQWHPELKRGPIVFPYQVGASLLLLISGYFAGVSLRRGNVVRWWLGRLTRMLPAYLTAVLLTSAFLWLFAPADWWAPTTRDVLANLGMLWNWKPDAYPKVEASYWTLPLQLVWFTAILVVWRSRRVHGPGTPAALWAVLAVELLLLPVRLHLHSESFRMLYDGLGLYRVHLFIAGVAVYLWSRRRVDASHACLLLTATLVAHLCQTREPSWTIGLAAGVIAVCCAALGPDWDAVMPRAAGRLLARLAGITYGVYLVHQSIGYVVMRRLQDLGAGPMTQLAAMTATALLLGWLLTVLVERPAHRVLTRGIDRLRQS